MAAYQYVFVMKGLCKTYSGGRQVLRDIWLSFLPGVKIGVIGLNGAGKSTLLRVMAGIDKDFVGEAWAAEGVRVGFLPQEPELDPQLNVLGNVMEGVAEKKALLDRYNEIAANYSDETADEMAALQDKIDCAESLGSRVADRDGDGRAALPGWRRGREQSLGRREAPRRAVQASARSARSAAAGRAHQPSRRGIGGVARAPFARIHRHRRAGHA